MSDGGVGRTDPVASDSDPREGAGDGSAVMRQAREAVESGRSALARDLLVDHVAATHDPDALVLLGQLLYQSGDLTGAGCAWFGTPAKGEQVSEAMRAWRQAHGDDFARMWRSLPEPVRRESRLPKVEALHAKAFPATPDAGSQGAQVAQPSEAQDAPVLGRTVSPREETAPSGHEDVQPDHDAARPDHEAARQDHEAEEATLVSGRESVGPVPAPTPQAHPVRSPQARVQPHLPAQPHRGASMHTEPPRHHAERRPAPPPGGSGGKQWRPDTSAGADQGGAKQPQGGQSKQSQGGQSKAGQAKDGQAKGGFDAARLIAWVLAAFFVFCAIVGLITILGWLVPGG